jgi:hypothetical protein
MTIVDIRAATDRCIKLSNPIVYDNGEGVDSEAALGQSGCVLRNDKPEARDASRYRWLSPAPYKIPHGTKLTAASLGHRHFPRQAARQ